MADFWSYSLTDILLFSPRVYFRLFELRNQALWPAQIPAIMLGLALVYWTMRPTPTRGRAMLATLGALWLWLAWSFFWRDYASINWAAPYVAPVAAMQGVLLIGAGAVRAGPRFAPPRDAASLAAVGFLVFAVAFYPLLAPAMGRPWSTAEIFGLAPDPTAVATMAALALAQGRLRWLLMLLPALWCVVTGVTLYALEAGEFFVAPACACAAIAAGLARNPRQPAAR